MLCLSRCVLEQIALRRKGRKKRQERGPPPPPPPPPSTPAAATWSYSILLLQVAREEGKVTRGEEKEKTNKVRNENEIEGVVQDEAEEDTRTLPPPPPPSPPPNETPPWWASHHLPSRGPNLEERSIRVRKRVNWLFLVLFILFPPCGKEVKKNVGGFLCHWSTLACMKNTVHSMLESNFCVQYSKIMGESRSSLGGKKGQHKGEDETDFETEEETRDRGGRKRRQLGRGKGSGNPFPPLDPPLLQDRQTSP